MTPPWSIVVLGLSITSSWGNGHATTYRSLLGALARRGHRILFLERDVPWYADHRDARAVAGIDIALGINASAQTLCRPGVLEQLDTLVAASGVPPRALTVELTEGYPVPDTVALSSVTVPVSWSTVLSWLLKPQ